jgi:hypothetical protein
MECLQSFPFSEQTGRVRSAVVGHKRQLPSCLFGCRRITGDPLGSSPSSCRVTPDAGMVMEGFVLSLGNLSSEPANAGVSVTSSKADLNRPIS